ncbi:MAG TPA: STN domain-containing protein [Ohtaekwangia sp.]|uniref:STN domain-containing protein n=1 Tax=Ohtaekwangia sp. TaxID=2066019 RepID=UPI002F937607
MLLYTGTTAFSQYMKASLPVNGISITCTNTPFHIVVDKLSTITGLHFIYSSNEIDVDRPVSLSVKDASLEKVLNLLGNQMNLTFRKRDRYVIIKVITITPIITATAKPVSRRKTELDKVTAYMPLAVNNASFTASTSRKPVVETRVSSSTDIYFIRHLEDFHIYFDTTALKKLPRREIRKVNIKTRHRSWYIAGGVMMNDYSIGAELQAGVRSLYVVVNPSWLHNGKYYGSYGLGTSLLLSRNFSFMPAYTYGAIRQKANIEVNAFHRTIENNIKLSSQHHQVKFMFQYAVTPNINIRLGPTLSYQKNRYSLRNTNVFVINHTRIAGPPGMGEIPEDPGYKTTGSPVPPVAFYGTFMEVIRTSENEFTQTKTTVGWEAGITYKINFFKHP